MEHHNGYDYDITRTPDPDNTVAPVAPWWYRYRVPICLALVCLIVLSFYLSDLANHQYLIALAAHDPKAGGYYDTLSGALVSGTFFVFGALLLCIGISCSNRKHGSR